MGGVSLNVLRKGKRGDKEDRERSGGGGMPSNAQHVPKQGLEVLSSDEVQCQRAPMPV